MHSWLNPLPAETMIGALVGAMVGSILERNDYFTISNWLESFVVLTLVLLVLLFGVFAHFYCAACFLGKDTISRWCFRGCLLSLLIVLFLYPRHFGIGPDASINFLPHAYNAVLAGILILWLATLRILTLVKRRGSE
jgi:hypothetical protein